MYKKSFVNFVKRLVSIFSIFLLSACGVSLKHIPSESISKISISTEHNVSIMVADVGDDRSDEPADRIGQGVSYWLPLSFYAKDNMGLKLPVSYYIAKSLSEDLEEMGYKTKLANDNKVRMPLTIDEAIAVAKREGIDYLVTTKLTDGKTNFWGFLIIPFFEPVWTRIAIDSTLYDINSEKKGIPIQTHRKETEWYFAKITIFDAIFDAGLFGRHWHRTAWGETVVSEALAETAKDITKKIQAKQ